MNFGENQARARNRVGRPFRRFAVLWVAVIASGSAALAQSATDTSTVVSAAVSSPAYFEVRFLEFDNVYLKVPATANLAKGMKLEVRHSSGNGKEDRPFATLRVTSVSPTSAICEVVEMQKKDTIEKGDRAYVVGDFAHVRAPHLSASTRSTATPNSTNLAAAPRPVAKANVVGQVSIAPLPSTAQVPSAAGERSQQGAANLVNPVAPTTTGQLVAISGQTPSPETQGVNNPATIVASPEVPSPATTPTAVRTSADSSVRTSAASNPVPAIAVPAQPQTSAVATASAAQQVDSVASSAEPPPPSPTPDASVQNPAASDADSATQSATNPIAPPDSGIETVFKVKFVAQDTIYIAAGTASGLTAGMKLSVKHTQADITGPGTLAKASQAPTIAEIEVISVASSSAVCEIKSKTADIQQGDLAFMDQATAQILAEKKALNSTRKYPLIVSFSEGDPLDEEVRAEVPRPPLPEVDRIRGRIGLDYSTISTNGNGLTASNSEIGMVFRGDLTRIGGSYWNLSGYWRGRLESTSSAEQPTLQDLINRTYHLDMTYSNPNSPWVAGFGRLYLPWATSLDTIDGGYIGRKAGKHATVGIFAGSTPDPTSWDYNPDQRIGGAFVNFEGGSFDGFRISSTSGIGVNTLLWQVDRPFLFFENSFSYKRFLSVYDATQADDPRPIAGLNAVGPGLGRNFFTLRLQPIERLSFDVNDNYFRDVPTFSTALIATGLLDKYLFQGLSVGANVEPIRHIILYGSVGKSSRTGDAGSSWNEMYGVTLAKLWRTGLRLDARASQFDSSFGTGNYRSISLSRNVSDALRLDLQFGQQNLTSTFITQGNSRFVNATVEGNLGRNYFVQGAFTFNRGGSFDYNQITATLGYRFDNRTPGVSK